MKSYRLSINFCFKVAMGPPTTNTIETLFTLSMITEFIVATSFLKIWMRPLLTTLELWAKEHIYKKCNTHIILTFEKWLPSWFPCRNDFTKLDSVRDKMER